MRVFEKLLKISEISALTLILVLSMQGSLSATPTVHWNEWNDEVFATAKREKKLVLLDLEAVWCHWCHVMHAETYSNLEIQKILEKGFITVKADQDKHIDLSARYQEYGWPATIILDAEGHDLRKLAGFIEPAEMKNVLEQVLRNPTTDVMVPEIREESAVLQTISKELSTELLTRYSTAMDRKTGGLNTSHRYLDPDSIEFALMRALKGKKEDSEWVRLTLDSNLKLIDPVWGGVYQYSARGDWDHPHFEKIVSTQAANMKLYALASIVLKEPKYLEAAKRIASYVELFLSDAEGGFYTSQDADLEPGKHSAEYFLLDDKARRALGVPRVDRNIYPRENGQLIEALSWLYSVSGEKEYLERAKRSFKWIDLNCASSGKYTHGKESHQIFLADNIWISRATLALYSVTADREYLKKGEETLSFIESYFRSPDLAGYFASSPTKAGVIRPVRMLSDNINLARAANLFFEYSGNKKYRETAERALAFIGMEDVALSSISEPGVLLASEEFAVRPTHLTIVGSKTDPVANQLWLAALKLPYFFRRIEWWDRAEGAMPNTDVQYPNLPRSAAFLCQNRRCSLPIFTESELREKLVRVDLLD